MIKILVSVGTHEVNFSRLCKKISNLDTTIFNVVVQEGPTSGVQYPDNYEIYDFVSSEYLSELALQADILISQASPGLISLAWASKSISICMPRMALYGEAVDNHQFDFANFIQSHSGTIVLDDETDLDHLVQGVFKDRFRILLDQEKVSNLFQRKKESMAKNVKQFVLDI